MASQRKKTWNWCSKYIRLKEALEYCGEANIDLRQFVRVEDIFGRCCSCGNIKSWIRMDGGHWIDRGSGGTSGVYFDERNVHLQCKPCNGGLYQGAVKLSVKENYDNYMLNRYGEDVMTELKLLDRIHIYRPQDIIGLELYYKQKYQELKEK